LERSRAREWRRENISGRRNHAGECGAAIRITNPYAVDVCSGVEAKPGKKDAKRMKAFMRAVEKARREADECCSKIVPDERGRYGSYGGRYVPETLMAPLEELEQAYAEASADAGFQSQLDKLLRDFAGRPRLCNLRHG